MANSVWQANEDARMAAEDAYSTFMKSSEAREMRETKRSQYDKKIKELNAAIEAANKAQRLGPGEDDEEEPAPRRRR